MATTYYSDHVVLNTAGVNTIEPRYNHYGSNTVVQATFAVPAAGFAINDIVNICDIPPNVFLTNVKFDTPSLDSNGSPLITLSVGTAATPAAFINASTTGRVGGIASMSVTGSLGTTFATTTRLQMKVAAAPATAVTTGTIVFEVSYIPQQ